MVKVHYFYDPMCGWCYGAASLIEAINDSEDFELVCHPGGMMNRQVIAPSFRQHVLAADKVIESQTDAIFGEDYKARVAGKDKLIFDSYLTTCAILVAEDMGLNAFVMLKAIQVAHYQQGKQVEVQDTLKKLALQLGLNEAEWKQKMQQYESKVVAVIQNTKKLMNHNQVNGFPTLLAEIDDKWILLPHSSYAKKPLEWKGFLKTLG
ncbi:MAG: DsbA family protein [Neptuniibacter sp.]